MKVALFIIAWNIWHAADPLLLFGGVSIEPTGLE
jgi:hypothetical protein